MGLHSSVLLICQILTMAALVISPNGLALDVVKVKQQPLSVIKSEHDHEILERALTLSQKEFGQFELVVVDLPMTSNRELRTALAGDVINITITPANKTWDNYLMPIRIPIRQGLLSYRLLLINKLDLPKFEEVNSFFDLNKLTAGVLNGWKTTTIFKSNQMNLTETFNFEGMFLMLDKHRFNYIPRSFYEVHDELESFKGTLRNIVIEPTLALRIKTETFFYVSRKHPRIFKRLTKGLEEMQSKGELAQITLKHFGQFMENAKLNKRKIIDITNPYYDDKEFPKELLTFPFQH